MKYEQVISLPCYGGNDLGAVWTPKHTTFKIWAPTAYKAVLHLYATGTDAEEGAAHIADHEMEEQKDGVWGIRLDGDLAGVYYTFELTFARGRRNTITDPYAKAVGANGGRAMVLNQAKAIPEGWAQDKCRPIPPHERSVWECHVGDFSADAHSGVPADLRGKYLAFTLPDTTLDGDGKHPTCLNYLKNLGVSYIQLLPIYDYATVDEARGRSGGYNWGYDPLNYNVPEGGFATDAFHGEVRVKECRAMIQALHRAGLGVVMDVVYNHTYHSDSNLERSVPGYWNRRNDRGAMTNGSGCGCDLATEHPMVRKYIVDSVVYWAKEYHIDGFRFDLMALLDVDTMNAIRAALDELPNGKDILMYGEPWMGGSTNMQGGARASDKWALDTLSDRIGFFCDNTRDSIKGSVFNSEEAGYVNGNYNAGWQVLHALSAWRGGEGGFTPKKAQQVVQYVSAHDNLTLWDKLVAVARHTDYTVPENDLLHQNRMAAGIYLTCQGLPFMQAGEEFGHTKFGDGNSYKGPQRRNQLDWKRAWTPKFAELTEFYRGLLAIRKAYPALSGADADTELETMPLPGWLIGFVTEHSQPGVSGRLAVYYNPERSRQWAALPNGRWRMLCNGTRVSAVPYGPARSGTLELAPVSVTILVAE